jgi:hypothetical protein
VVWHVSNLPYKLLLGAFKATPIRQLETESYVPPLDLWLNRRITRFQAQIEHSGIGQKVRDACKVIRYKILRRTTCQRRAKAQVVGRAMDRTGNRPVGLAGKNTVGIAAPPRVRGKAEAIFRCIGGTDSALFP